MNCLTTREPSETNLGAPEDNSNVTKSLGDVGPGNWAERSGGVNLLYQPIGPDSSNAPTSWLSLDLQRLNELFSQSFLPLIVRQAVMNAAPRKPSPFAILG
ncbi:unnamed protein product [Clonostachys rosea]|uniref:Uncharacterized protein n=1 Tax=Bionectria ochroleuca TaxID=29856 RepID=A0ABY6UDN8_BIOOC|nr:unnamed protein product [Clonostachys rosea]